MTTITRFAPSPTGLKHAGNYRTAVFCYLFAKKRSGSFLVRIEDTDLARAKEGSEQIIFETLGWLGLTPDKPPTHSSEHIERHKELLKKLVTEDRAYVSHEPKKDDPSKMVDVVRLRNPKTNITFHDEIRGDITFDTSEHGDFVIARAIDDPLYHFAVVVDDGDVGITHIIRGEDHISNTPRHILIQRALGFSQPSYTHLPLLFGSDRSKLSTRNGAKPLIEYRDAGILPGAMLNYLALLGWNPGDDREYMTREELIGAFDLSRVQKGGAVFDEVKLLSVNQHWMRALPDSDFLAHVRDFVSPSHSNETRSDLGNLALRSDLVSKTVPLLKERAQTFVQAREMLSDELSCLFNTPALELGKLRAKEPADRPETAKNSLEGLSKLVEALPECVSAEQVKEALMPLADEAEAKGRGGRGAVLWPLRYALSGQDRSPDPFTIISIIGVKEAVQRLQAALGILKG